MTTWNDDDSHDLTITLVAHDGHRLPLVGDERTEAVRLMVARGLDTPTIAYRLCLDLEALRRWAKRHQVALPPPKPPQPWWVEVSCPSSSTRSRRRQKQDQRDRATTAARSH